MRFHSAVPIGSGGTGRVLRAFDPELGHEVALKLLHLPTPELAARLQREARAQARIEHPHVARIYGSGELDGQPYIAMQLVEGEPLDRVAARLPLTARVRLLLPVLDAIACAHRLGLVHRDLKPSNILVETAADGSLKPYVLDFGLVQDLEDGALTAAGELLGTPGYLSPEQASSGAPVDARSDVFSLGVIFYQLCSGRLPFAADSVAASIALLLRHDPPALHRLDPALPQPLGRIVQRCLEKDPAERYPSVRALEQDLRRFLDGEPVLAPRYGWEWRVRRWLRASPARRWALALAAALPLVAFAVWTLQRLEQDRLVRQAQAFTASALEIEAAMQLAALWPEQDMAAHRERLRPALQALERAWSDQDAGLRQVAAEPLARALEALGERERLLALLERSEREGLHTPALAGRHGRALLREHLDAQAALVAVADPERRQLLAQELAQRWLQLALRQLERAALGHGLESQLAQALLAQQRGEREQALALLDELPPPAPPALLLAAQWRLQALLDLLDAGAPEDVGRAMAQAETAYGELSERMRSLPQAWAGLCQLEDLRLRHASRSGGSDSLPAALHSCDRALGHDSEDRRLLALRAQAYNALARRAVMLGQSPLPALERLRATPVEPGESAVALALGETLLSASEYLRRSGGDGDALLTEAEQILSAAAALAPADVGLLLALSGARQLQAIHGDAAGSDPRYALAVATIESALSLQPLWSTRLRLAEVLSWWGNARYHALGDPSAELERAIELLDSALAALPQDLRVLQRAAFAQWTAGQYRAATGADAAPYLRAAERHYDLLLELDPSRSATRFNRLSVQFGLARHHLQGGRSASAELARARQGFPGLLVDSVGEDLRLQRAALGLLELRESARDAPLSAAGFDAVRQMLLAAFALPRDRAAAAMQLADLWVQRQLRMQDRAALGEDIARIDAVAEEAGAPRLLALHRARLLHHAASLDPAAFSERAQTELEPFLDSPFLHPYRQEFGLPALQAEPASPGSGASAASLSL